MHEVTIRDKEKEYVPIEVAAMRLYTTRNALQLWLWRHRDVHRIQLANLTLVCISDLKGYRRINGR